MRRAAALALAVALGAGVTLTLRAQEPRKRCLRGNTHTHTLWSDGDQAPEVVVGWYREHGYDFLVLSDHNVVQDHEKWVHVGGGKGSRLSRGRLEALVARVGSAAVTLREKGGETQMRLKTLTELRAAFEAKDRFLLITGEEVTDSVDSRPVHHGAVNLARKIEPTGGKTVAECLERTAAAGEEEARRSGRPVLVHLNHPNFHWGVTPDEIARARGERFFEVYNGHSSVRNRGDDTHKSTEQLWDYALTVRLHELKRGPLYALATDDAHNYHGDADAKTGPGRGWIHVRAADLEASTVTRAMLEGDFYASTGVRLEDVQHDAASLTVTIAAEPGVTYTTRFFGTRLKEGRPGEPGVLLKETKDAVATYAFQGDELYVRAQVTSSRKHPAPSEKGDVESAWTQPVVVRK